MLISVDCASVIGLGLQNVEEAMKALLGLIRKEMAELMMVKGNLSDSNHVLQKMREFQNESNSMQGSKLIELTGKISWETNLKNTGRLTIFKGFSFFFFIIKSS